MVEFKGSFIISLDFELFWGVRDVLSKEEYGLNILGARKAIPLMIALFEKYGVHVTFATVGLLFCKSKEEIEKYSPALKPAYTNKKLSPYLDNYIDRLSDIADPYHSAEELIGLVKKSPNIEIGSHTFSHYYCWEEGQSIDEFQEDIKAAVKIAEDNGVTLKSIIFPRNQVDENYLKVCSKFGFTNYRGNPSSFFNKNGGIKDKIMRFIDAYINISGDSCFDYDDITGKILYNIKASRFLRPYNSKFAFLDSLKLKRIKGEMTAAAQQNKIYHLWWHPHNFGSHQKQNLEMLEDILKHYQMLMEKYRLESYTMSELTNLFIK